MFPLKQTVRPPRLTNHLLKELITDLEKSKSQGPVSWEVTQHYLCVYINHRMLHGGLRQREAFEQFLHNEGIEAGGFGFVLHHLSQTHDHDDISATDNENRLQFLKALALLPLPHYECTRMLGGWYSNQGLWLLDDFGNLVDMGRQQIWAGCYFLVGEA
jgi:hypothetical protein